MLYSLHCSAPPINDSDQQHANPCLNLHQPYFSENPYRPREKQHKINRYENMLVHRDKHKRAPKARDYLKPGVSFEILHKIDHQISDKQLADQLQRPEVYPLKSSVDRH